MTRDAIGARVFIQIGIDGCRVRELRADESPRASHHPVLDVDLGMQAQIRASVCCPNGDMQKLGILHAGRDHAIAPETIYPTGHGDGF